jgi:hypothetical protein
MTFEVEGIVRSRWFVPTALVLLSVIPVTAGVVRVAGLAAGGPITAQNARFFASPVPVVVHIVSASVFLVLGPWQFLSGFRRRRPGWHWVAGRVLVLCGLGAGLSGLWMAAFYPDAPGDGAVLRALRLLFGWVMVSSLVLGFAAVLRGRVSVHRAWMIRAYAVGQGAGTQVLTNLAWQVAVSKPEGLSRAMLLCAGWLINLVIAEWLIRRRPSRRRGSRWSSGPPGAPSGMDPRTARERQVA